MAYTYDDFLNRLNQSGLRGQFSQWDLETAQQFPEFGISMLSLKQDYNNATTDLARQMANQKAEQLRSSYGGYLGGGEGDLYVGLGKSPSDYQSKYGTLIDETIDRMNNYGDFSYGAAPSYESRWDAQMQDILNEMINRQPYLYNLETDPVWAAYKKQYTREGQRATADTLAQVSAMTGGMPSSYAVNAATQAGDYYAAQMTDMIPQLYQQAYERYLNEYTLKQNDLAAVQSMEQMDYGKYQDQLNQYNVDRNLAYSQWQDQYNMLSNNLSQMQTQDQIDYGRFGDDLSWDQQLYQNVLDQQAAGQQSAAAQVESILAAGGVPSAELVAQSGLSQEYIDTMSSYYARAAAASAGSGGGGGSSKGSQSEEPESMQSVFELIYENGLDPADYWYSTGGAGTAANVDAFVKNYNNWLRNREKNQENPKTPTQPTGGSPMPISTLMTQAGNMIAAGNNIGAAEYLIMAAQGGALTEEQLERILTQLGLGGVIGYE